MAVVSLALTLLRTGPQTRTCTRAQRPGAAADPCPWLHRPAPPPAARVPCASACPQIFAPRIYNCHSETPRNAAETLVYDP